MAYRPSYASRLLLLLEGGNNFAAGTVLTIEARYCGASWAARAAAMRVNFGVSQRCIKRTAVQRSGSVSPLQSGLMRFIFAAIACEEKEREREREREREGEGVESAGAHATQSESTSLSVYVHRTAPSTRRQSQYS